MVIGSRPGENSKFTMRNHTNTLHLNKIGRLRCRSKHQKSGHAKTRDRWHGHKLYANTKLHIGDLKRYHMQKITKVPSTLVTKSTCCNNIKRCHLIKSNKVHGTNNIIDTVYYILKRYHLN